MSKVILKPTKESVFKAKLSGKPVDMIGGYKEMEDHLIYIDLLCKLGVLERTAKGVFVVYPIEVTYLIEVITVGKQWGCSVEHTQILNPCLQIQEWGVFYIDGDDALSYKEWMIKRQAYDS